MDEIVLAQDANFQITSPQPNANLSGIVTITGTVNPPDLQQYFFEVANATADRAALRYPDSPLALNNLAALLATSSDPSMRDGEESVRLAEKACALTQYNNSSALSTLAAAYAEAGRFNDAVAMSEKACALAASRAETNILAGNQQMLQSFRQKRPFHVVP